MFTIMSWIVYCVFLSCIAWLIDAQLEMKPESKYYKYRYWCIVFSITLWE